MLRPQSTHRQHGAIRSRVFTAATTFDGARSGHVFNNGAHGLGYYRDGATAADG